MGHMEDHAAFVGTYTGCAQHELFLAEIVFMLAIVVRNLSLPWVFLGRKFNTSIYVYWFKFLLDYAFLVLPPLLAMTTLSDSLFLLTCVLTACLLTLLVFICCEYFASPDRPTVKVVLNRIIDEQHRPTTFVTYYRASVLLLVATAILAVDFPVFPRRHTKTEKYGHSLMDVGVAAFIFASALASRVKNMSSWEASTRRKNWNRWLRSSYVILPLIGITRTAILTFLDYPQHVTEYGVHWNFFYTLAVVKIVSMALPKTYPLFWACTFGVLQQTMLIQGYEKWILDGDNQRDNFFTANAEGICSLMGYLTIYYISDTIGLFISKTGIRIKSWIECCWRLFVFSLVFFIMQRLSEYTLGPPSRRVVNMTYVFAQMSLLTFGLAGLLCVQLFSIIAWAANVPYFCIDDSPWSGVEPCLTVSVNKSGLVFFLLSNLFTDSTKAFLAPRLMTSHT
ncbi:unnamed protein product [Cylicocyclus nassatus]|uniref:Phosphatidylinositol-glycan biosynthesis class W protein n=1 Tax=Cylicocyclus nassatus TaxID=53992 RepID=A0AA36HDI4_CYLNA|nr:unnamed protein product [Cylicocyclus nassatus]